jgi:transglutaminase-like putative cysteine protease
MASPMKYQLRHLTRYRYQHPVANSYNLACLEPRVLAYQQVQNAWIEVQPFAQQVSRYIDGFGNVRHLLHVQAPHSELAVLSCAEVAVLPRNYPASFVDATPIAELAKFLQTPIDQQSLFALWCTQPSKMIPILPEAKHFIAQLQSPEQSALALALRLNQYIFENFQYDPQFSSVVTQVDDVLKHRRGVCQDFAQLAISCLRSIGVPARYVSGYLQTLPPEGQARLMGADASHAWFSVFDPIYGWVDFDPTNNLIVDTAHITLAYGRDYSDVVPLKGVLQGGGEHELSVAVDVIPQ